jgi:hypothetical protein
MSGKGVQGWGSRVRGAKRVGRMAIAFAGASLVLCLTGAPAPARTTPEKPTAHTGPGLAVGSC